MPLTGSVFGAAHPIPQAQQRLQNAPSSAAVSPQGPPLDGWVGHLVAVDEERVIRLWRRLLADSELASHLVADEFLLGLRPAIAAPQSVPSDTNASYIARGLLECADGNVAIPLCPPFPKHPVAALRMLGSVTTIRTTSEGFSMRVTGISASPLVRFRGEAFLDRRPRDLAGTEVLVLAGAEEISATHLIGLALLARRRP